MKFLDSNNIVKLGLSLIFLGIALNYVLQVIALNADLLLLIAGGAVAGYVIALIIKRFTGGGGGLLR